MGLHVREGQAGAAGSHWPCEQLLAMLQLLWYYKTIDKNQFRQVKMARCCRYRRMGSLTRPFNDVLAIVMEMMKEMMVVMMIVRKEVDDDGCEAVLV
jgi:hypothetical protein